MKLSLFVPGICALVASFILLTLPGDELAKAQMFDIKGFDKIVHTLMFSGLTWLFCRAFRNSALSRSERKKWFFSIAFYALAYGVLMEFVQKYFVRFRSFELADILVDCCGCVVGYIVSSIMFSGKKLV